ncbi:heme-binding protein [Clostridium algoriphilum]|uniref:heme-degrading domain-containing protein n=1 Tax=Clostridium algoriphilum TaxID=198347 RepID=UPI001CF2918E|nr:heme-binding protein [Clostridium algoriphilum]MCB2294762.1 heme-binding protein [Clostridium algoriphilum]
MKHLLKLEEKLQFTKFSSEDALNLGLTFIEIAKEINQGGIGIKIERNRQVLFSHLMDSTMLENAYWYDRKKNVVDRYNHSSMYVKEMYKAMGTTFDQSSLLNPSEFQAVGGSFPLIVKNVGVVGSITVCGLTEDLDHQICVDGIRQFLEFK